MWLSVFLSACDVDYCDVVWVNLDQALDTKIQKLQNSAARITILQGYSVRSAEIRKQIIKTRRDYSGSVFKSNLHDLCVLCQVTWLNADDPSTEWLSIWMDPGVLWVYLMTAYYYHANQKDYLCVDKDQEYVHDTEQFGPKWRLAVPRGREFWLSSVSSICSASRADMRCLHQVRMSFPVS